MYKGMLEQAEAFQENTDLTRGFKYQHTENHLLCLDEKYFYRPGFPKGKKSR